MRPRRRFFVVGFSIYCGRRDGIRKNSSRSRVSYNNKLDDAFSLPPDAPTTSRIPFGNSMYRYDLKEHARYFDARFRIEYLFGDVIHVPPRPTVVKSRPIDGDNRNSVVMNPDKFRHFHTITDPVSFDRKQPAAVWRGGATQRRRVFVEAGIGLPAAISDSPRARRRSNTSAPG